MDFYDIEQNTDDWYDLRVGKRYYSTRFTRQIFQNQTNLQDEDIRYTSGYFPATFRYCFYSILRRWQR